jgi:phosphonate transport system permease protein
MTNLHRDRILSTYEKQPKRWVMNLVFFVLFVIAIVFSFSGASINWARFANIGMSLGDMFRNIVKINWDFFFGVNGFSFYQGIVYLTLETLGIAFIGTFLGGIIAIPFGFLAAENVVGKKWAKFFEIILLMIRVFPEIILAFILIQGFGMNALSGVLTIGMHSIGMLGKLYSEAIDNMDRSPLEALDSVGANAIQKIRYGILPNIIPDLSSIALYRLDINVRAATILGIVSAGGIGTLLNTAITMWSWSTLGNVLLGIIIMVLSVDYISSKLRSKLI